MIRSKRIVVRIFTARPDRMREARDPARPRQDRRWRRGRAL
jgi:hypothetical protein